MCNSSLEYIEEGQQVIIKALKGSIYDSVLEYLPIRDKTLVQLIETYKSKPTVSYEICDESVLRVQDQLVIGNINKNYHHKKSKRIYFIRRFSKKWAKKLRVKLNTADTKYQSWNLNKFAKTMKKRWKSL